ncbi:MAG: DNA polymerase III subunit gamma/tau [Azoarcus sp.]|nr:DNA polymerase III subunit gamma/tau [Azoarcus sp.]
MSYQVLARKWRPLSFATLVGQDHVVRALSHALETGRLHHAWLFTGTRGVGKTTISRILAKALNCETGVTPEPCGQCEACRAIDADRFPDYVEMDAASNRGVDDMAALLDRAVYAPVQGRYKVYMIDEVHMLTGHAFNAMLKTLEEPPEHVKFILATTDPQKIPVTVLSRCLQFNLKQMSPGAIVDHLGRILGEEGVEFEPPALAHLARAANGSMRDALSLLDQAIAHGAGRLEEEGVSRMLGTVGDDHLYALLDALAAGDTARMVALADAMEARSLSFDAGLQALASLFQRIALVQLAPAAIADEVERARLAEHAARFDAEFVQLAYQIAIHGRSELTMAPDEATGFTMTLLRLAAFRPEQPPPIDGPLSGVGGDGAGRARPLPEVASPAKPAVAAPPVAAVPVRTEPAATAPENRPTADGSAREGPPWEDVPPASPDDRPVSAEERFASDAPEATRADDANHSNDVAGALDAALSAGDWHAVQRILSPGGLVRELCQHCEWVGFADDRLDLRLANTHKHLIEVHAALVERLGELVSERAGRKLRVRVEVGAIEGETPAQRANAERQARHVAAVAALERDPFVGEIIERFDARFVEESVRPL